MWLYLNLIILFTNVCSSPLQKQKKSNQTKKKANSTVHEGHIHNKTKKHPNKTTKKKV